MDIPPEIAIMNKAGSAGLPFYESQQALMKAHPLLVKNDARISVFSKCINVIESTSLAMNFIYIYLTDDNWWQSKSKERISNEMIDRRIRNFDMFTKIGFFQLLFSSIESSFRLIAKALDPTACNNGTSEFKSIYSWLLKRLKLQKWEPLLDLMRCIRNTTHNNGVYFHQSGKDEIIEYNQAKYIFVIGAPIKFTTWDFFFDIVADVEKMLTEVINTSEISSIPVIIDVLAY